MKHFDGILCIANIRGGGEYGEDWHAGGCNNDGTLNQPPTPFVTHAPLSRTLTLHTHHLCHAQVDTHPHAYKPYETSDPTLPFSLFPPLRHQ